MVKKNKQTPFNARPQTPQKYQDVLNTPSSLEATGPGSGDGASHGTSSPKEDPTLASKPKIGRRIKDDSSISKLFKNPIFYAVISAVLWASNTTHSLESIKSSLSSVESKYEDFFNGIEEEIEILNRKLEQAMSGSNSKDVENNSQEFSFLNFSRKKTK